MCMCMYKYRVKYRSLRLAILMRNEQRSSARALSSIKGKMLQKVLSVVVLRFECTCSSLSST